MAYWLLAKELVIILLSLNVSTTLIGSYIQIQAPLDFRWAQINKSN